MKKTFQNEVHKMLGAKYLHPKFNFYLDWLMPFDSPELPTSEEVKKGIPAPTGWLSGIEDCALNNGISLSSQVLAYDFTKERKYRERGKRMLQGLFRLCTCGHPGFVARSVWGDGGSVHWTYSSIDQYTFVAYGLWRAYHSSILNPEEKKKIQEILAGIAEKFYREKGEITAENGRPEKDFTGGGPRHSFMAAIRTLEMFLAAWSVTGDKKFYRYYQEWLKDSNYPSIPEMARNCVIPELMQLYTVFQNQIALQVLYEVDSDRKMQKVYEESMAKMADFSLAFLGKFKYFSAPVLQLPEIAGWRKIYENFEGWSNLKELMGMGYYWHYCKPATTFETRLIAEPVEALAIIALSNIRLSRKDKASAEKILNSFPYQHCRISHSLTHYEFAYWHALKKGLFRPKP